MKKISNRSKFLIALVVFIAVILVVGVISPLKEKGILINEPSEAARMYGN